MTNDLFKEIEEDLERQRYEELWKRYGNFIIAGAAAIVLITAGVNIWQTHVSKEHRNATDGLIMLSMAHKDDSSQEIQALEEFAEEHQQQSQATFARLEAAALADKDGKTEQAIKIYDNVANDGAADHAFRELADLLSVGLQIDTGDAATLQKRLQPLMADKEPWRYSAMEYSALIAMRAGDVGTAKKLLTQLAQDAEAPKSLSDRAADELKALKE